MDPGYRIRALLLVALVSIAAGCDRSQPAPPVVEVGVLGVFNELGGLLVVAQEARGSIHARIQPGASGVVPRTVRMALRPWAGGEPIPLVIWDADEESANAAFDAADLAEGLWTAMARVEDERGQVGIGQRTFVVRRRRGPPPIGESQGIWLDFSVDQDGIPGRDFARDLEAFGLGSRRAPDIAARIELRVIEGVLDAVREAYLRREQTATGWPEHIEVHFSSTGELRGDQTRVCVGGAHPGGLGAVGSVALDPNNAERGEVLCGPEAGVFPRGLRAYTEEGTFRDTFDPLLASRGGVPAGEHPLDPLVLGRDFELSGASLPAGMRWVALERAIKRFSQALATVVAHEVGHSLGLVAPGAPPTGLAGGTTGEGFSHAQGEPVSLMSPGSRFRFATLAGLERGGPPRFRPLDWAYLRDQLIVEPGAQREPPPPAFLRPHR